MWVMTVARKLNVPKAKKWVWVMIGLGIVGGVIGIGVSAHRFSVDQVIRKTAARIESKVDETAAKVTNGVDDARRATDSFRRKGCGEFRYRIGEKCVDARDRAR